MTTPSLKICLDMRFPDGPHGGTCAVADAFSHLDDGDEEYLFLVEPSSKGGRRRVEQFSWNRTARSFMHITAHLPIVSSRTRTRPLWSNPHWCDWSGNCFGIS